MKHTEGKFNGKDGIDLYYQGWHPVDKPRACVAILHGAGGHSGQSTFTYLIEDLVASGYSLYGLDLRGFGRSGGKRCSINRWEEYRDDLTSFLGQIREKENNRSIFIIGQSLGGLIALEFVLHHPREINGVIVSAPVLSVPNLSPVKRTLAQMMSPFFPHLMVSAKLDITGLSRDSEQTKKILDDPLIDLRLSPRLSTETLYALRWTTLNAHNFKVPIMIIHGTADPLMPPEGSRTFFEHLTIEDKILKLYEGGYHQSFIDVNRNEVIRDVVNWLNQHTLSQR
jgi:alpha-beta hydrolase superfamily lysophospholipase